MSCNNFGALYRENKWSG
ncbi:Protein CBG27746 [Caenorhabditis briggsae]|uniref:Protein CBG27746 n=1 Tax=Caenorhabditis briggsae TaxID=6238 RepID=B6IJ44_CAEBR|nr:Protein CBG27746 [Caenorhabditis briggsae]CAS00024.1 Protein CBG27746 [Caenorhabditis briggsae]